MIEHGRSSSREEEGDRVSGRHQEVTEEPELWPESLLTSKALATPSP